ncbi:aminotransferase class I/II-fold pyridoxal phosphate-dependent enzyme [Rhodobacterales bacterium HKCCE3408]|nr:aminotransferase class I/II-fold pyridoxal phosphate-dependent enzyme [Rhodobacterales bacterium HKCCE3408]
MVFPERFANLPAYAFPRLRSLLDAHMPGGEVINMTIGEPRHPFPGWVADVLARHIDEFAKYPPNPGAPELLEVISGWLSQRYGVSVGTDRILALNGTREGLYNAVLALCPEQKAGKKPVILTPNPFYQVYMMGALTLGAEPVFVPATAETGFLPDYASLPDETLDRTAIAFVCSPSNPQGAVADDAYWRTLIALAEKHDFLVIADECYSEIWRDAPPPGGLAASAALGADPERMLVFHSLSKRSNLPGLRSGFCAGGPKCIAAMNELRAYSGAPLPLPLQRVAERIWADETHVEANRALYHEKYALADAIFGQMPDYVPPKGGFFLWLPVPEGDGEAAALRLWTETGVRVLPGGYLGRSVDGANPGDPFIRVAMVAPLEECERGLKRIRDGLYR